MYTIEYEIETMFKDLTDRQYTYYTNNIIPTNKPTLSIEAYQITNNSTPNLTTLTKDRYYQNNPTYH